MATRWIFGARVTTSNQSIPFDRGGNKTATLRLGDYTVGQLATEAARAVNAADTGQSYTCVFDFSTLKFTFDNGATAFALEWTRDASTNAAGLFGFDDADTASSAAGHESTSAVGAGFSTLSTWAPTDPPVTFSPVTAAADGTTATRLSRKARAVQQETDGGLRETAYFSTDKLFRIQYRYLSASEQANFIALVAWLETGAPANYVPDTASTNTLRLVLLNPGATDLSFSWTTRPEADVPELLLVEQLSRT